LRKLGGEGGWDSKMCIRNTTARLAAAAVATAMLSAALPTAMAQQSGKTVQPTKVQGAAAPVAKPAKPVQRNAASQTSRAAPVQSREWTLEDALPERSVIMRQYEPVRPPDVGRVPLRSGPGSIGLATDTVTNPNRLPDGRAIPSLESNAQRSSSYVGLSLSVPTSDKAMNIPLPFAPPQ
jgi:hypothetical protein